MKSEDTWDIEPLPIRRGNVFYDAFNNARLIMADLNAMMCPALCGICGSAFDLAACQSMGRYADCDVFRTSCCNRRMDSGQARNPTQGYYPINHDGTLRR